MTDPRPAAASSDAITPLRGALTLTILWSFVIALVIARRPFDIDGWWHIRVGEWIVAHHRIPTHDPFSWTTTRAHWQLSGWLYDWSMGALGRVFPIRGAAAVVMLVCFAALGPLVFAASRRAGATPWSSCLAACAVQAGMIPFASERPQIVSYVIFCGVLALLPGALRGSWAKVGWLVLLFVLWANVHLAFTIGIAVVGAAGLGYAVMHRRWLAPAVTLVAVTLAGLVSPSTYRAYTAALKIRGSALPIDEWQHASLGDARAILVGGILLVTIVLMVRDRRWRNLETSLPLAMLTLLFLNAIRNGPFALLLGGPELALGVAALATTSFGRRLARLRRVTRPMRDGVVVGLGILIAFSAITLTDARGVDDTTLPRRSVAAIPAGCRLLNEYAQGGYIIATRGPDVLVSEDTRQILSDAAIIEQQHVLQGRPGAIRWIDTHHVDCVLLEPQRPLRRQLEARGWKVVARDPSGVLLVRPGTPT